MEKFTKAILEKFPFPFTVIVAGIIFVPLLFAKNDIIIAKAIIQANLCTPENYLCLLGYSFRLLAVVFFGELGVSIVRKYRSRKKASKITTSNQNPQSIELNIRDIFSKHLDRITKGVKISGIGRSFLNAVKDAPPFLGLNFEQANPTIPIGVEKVFTEWFLAKELITSNSEVIKGGGAYQVKQDDTWEEISKKVYGSENYVETLLGYNNRSSLPPKGSYISTPYIDISNKLGVSSAYLERKYQLYQGNEVVKAAMSLVEDYELLEEEVMPLMEMIYIAAQRTLADHQTKNIQ